jgi:lipoprotein-anchoring transpeptidase ErfK/SrfK
MMKACFVAAVMTVAGLAGMLGEAAAQYRQPGPYAPPGPNRAAPIPDDDDDLVAVPAPGPYGRPSATPYPLDIQRPPTAIQREALPMPGIAPREPYSGSYPDSGAVAPNGRGYSYGPWEQIRPPADLLPPPGPPGIYSALPPDYQPERGQPKELPAQFRRQIVDYSTKEAAGTIIIDTPNTYLYLVLGGGKALRYGIGVGREGFTWAGREKISKMAEWPDWHPPKEMIDRQPYLPRFMAGGESNPLGARALYLGNTVYRIHGTNQPSTIGSFVSSGCIRLTNADIEDLYGRVTVGNRVVVLPGKQPPETTASAR